jgi:hypothetical protein
MSRKAELTRRQVLGGAAGALLVPRGALAEALQGRVFGRWVGSVAGTSRPLAAGHRFSVVGVEWSGPRRARIELRTLRSGLGWSPWAVASVLGHDPDRGGRDGALYGEPVWTGAADYAQLRTSERVNGVRVHFVAAGGPAPGARAAAALPLAQPVLDAGPGQPAIIARAAWAQGRAPHAPIYYGTVSLAFVHHTQSLNGYSPGEVPGMLLAIFDYHRYVRGYRDIAYNFLIDAFGRIWEGRAGGIDEPVIGAHAGGYNLFSAGVAVLGTFISAAPPPAALSALEQLLAWKLSLHGVPATGKVTVVVDPAGAYFTPFAPGAHVSLPRIAGHRDGDMTDCPGDTFYARLPAIRPKVAALCGDPAKVTLAPGSSQVQAGVDVQLAGTLARLSGSPLAGEPIELQSVTAAGATTLSSAVTDSSGAWSATLPLEYNAGLRALHRPAPAAVSDVAEIGVVPVIEASITSLVPLRVAGSVFPPKSHVRVDLFAAHGRRRRLVASKRVVVRGGRFVARLGVRAGGRFLVTVKSDADGFNVAGAAQPLVLSV